MEDKISTVLGQALFTSSDEEENITDATIDIADAIKFVAWSLGSKDASTPMGAIEMHGAAIIEAADKIASSINYLAEAIEGLKE